MGRRLGGLCLALLPLPALSPVLCKGLGVASQGALAHGGRRPLGLRGLHSMCAPAIEPWVVFSIHTYLMKVQAEVPRARASRRAWPLRKKERARERERGERERERERGRGGENEDGETIGW